jgi:hypothetical protein
MNPTITVAIPLHGSAPWVDNVVDNVRALPPMVTEVIISDQTCIDDAAAQIAIRLADDPRVTVRAQAAGLGFTEHYHQLLETASGDLFMWMPHDDIFDPGWVPTLAGALAAHPQAWLAFGQLRCVKSDGKTPIQTVPLPVRPGLISPLSTVRLMMGVWMGYPFRGLFRRKNVLAANIRMDPATSLVAVDQEWVFSVALHAPLVYDDRTVTWKRLYEGSTVWTPRWQSQRRGNEQQAAVRLLRLYGPTGIAGVGMRAYVVVVATVHRLRAAIGKHRYLRGSLKYFRLPKRFRHL